MNTYQCSGCANLTDSETTITPYDAILCPTCALQPIINQDPDLWVLDEQRNKIKRDVYPPKGGDWVKVEK